MGLLVFSRRGIHYKQDKGEYIGLYIPTVDETIVYRDVPANTTEVVQRMGMPDGTPLWREERGQAVVYGLLPPSLRQLRQSLKVWLASDYVADDVEAFFYIFEQRLMIHGVRESDEEGQQHWRVTVLEYPPETIYQNLADLAGDILLNANIGKIVIALEKDYNNPQLLNLLNPLQLKTVPFESLKPNPRNRLLYRHRDFTLPMLVSLFFMGLLLAIVLVWWLLAKIELSGLQTEIQDVRTQISNIQINDNLGQVDNPEDLLQVMKTPFAQQPSAIIDAAARVGAVFGDLHKVEFQFTPDGAGDGATSGSSAEVLTPDERKLIVETSTSEQAKLVNQEELAKRILPSVPWIRSITNQTNIDKGMQLGVVVQIDSPEGGAILPSATTVPDLSAVTSAEVTPTMETAVSQTTSPEAAPAMVSATTASITPSVPAPVSASATGPVSASNAAKVAP